MMIVLICRNFLKRFKKVKLSRKHGEKSYLTKFQVTMILCHNLLVVQKKQGISRNVLKVMKKNLNSSKIISQLRIKESII